MNYDQIKSWLRTRGLSKDSEEMLANYVRESETSKNLNLMIEAFKPNHHVVYMECFPSHFICISVDSQKLNGFISLIGFQSELFKVRTMLEGAISSLGMQVDMIDQDKMVRIEKENFLKRPMLQEVLLQGYPAQPAKPAQADLVVKPLTDNPEYSEKDDGSIDYTDLNLFENVVAEQHIADHIPATPGVPGRDVYGAMISAHQAAKDVTLCGSGVLYDENAQKYYAAKAGYVIVENGKLSVEDTYVVERNVDFRVGNVNFVSHVKVKGDVLPDFSISTGGNLEIFGTVTGAALQVEKDLKMALGVLGQGKGHIRVGGKATLKFLNETYFESMGPVEIHREALNAHLSTLDEIHAKSAVVIGGQIVALKAMHIGTLGSELGLKTRVHIGEDYNILSRTEQLMETLMEQKEKVELIYEHQQSTISNWQFDKIKDNCDIEKLEKTFTRLQTLKEALIDLVSQYEELNALCDEPPADREPVCYVYNMLYAGTSFYCSGATLDIKEKMKGPLKIVASKEGEKKKYSIAIEKM